MVSALGMRKVMVFLWFWCRACKNKYVPNVSEAGMPQDISLTMVSELTTRKSLVFQLFWSSDKKINSFTVVLEFRARTPVVLLWFRSLGQENEKY